MLPWFTYNKVYNHSIVSDLSSLNQKLDIKTACFVNATIRVREVCYYI